MMGKTIRRILVAVDPSKPRAATLDRALVLARAWNAELHPFTPQGDDAAGAIVAQARLAGADLILISRDFGSTRVWRAPRVAAAVGRTASVPVLIMPAPPLQPAPHSAAVPFTQVVVALDFTVASAVALGVAADLVAHSDGHGTVVHALPYASPMVFSGGEASRVADDLQEQATRAEVRLRNAIPAVASHRMKTRVVAGAAGQAILDAAADVDADLVVMGVPRRNRLAELAFGSTFRKVIRRSLRPILAVPVAGGAQRWTGATPAGVVRERNLRAA